MTEEYMELPVKVQNIVPHPWRRYFARTLDMSIYGIIVTSFFLLVVRWDTAGDGFASLVEIAFSRLLMILIEPILLSKLGTTPGKWIFGLELRDNRGNKITYSDGLWRVFNVLKTGMGFSIPLYNIYRLIKSYNTCNDQNEMLWDQDFTYLIKDKKSTRVVGYIGSWLLIIAISIFIGVQAQLPINRGDITTIEYYENCNDFMTFYKMDNGMEVNNLGEWIDNTPAGTFVFNQTAPPKHQIIYNNGQIQKVVIEIELKNENVISNYQDHLLMAYFSLVGAEKSLNGMNLFDNQIVEYFNDNLNDFEFVKAGYRISNLVEYEGYQEAGRYLFPKEDTEQYFYLMFVIERIDM